MILLLLLLLSTLLITSWVTIKNKLLSPTIISIIAFLIFTSIYILCYKVINYDISLETVLIIASSLVFTFFGEIMASNIPVLKVSESFIGIKKIDFLSFTRIRSYFVFIFMLFIFIIRFYDLYLYSMQLGNSSGILGTISSVRLSYAMGEYTGGNIIIALFTTGSEILCYFYIYLFFNSLQNRKKLYHLLLPVFGYSIIVISFTGRMEYLKIGIVALIIYLICMQSANKIRGINTKFIRKMAKMSIVVVLLFFGYGNLTRDNESSILNDVVSYSAASIVGLDTYLKEPWQANPYFGYYTTQNIYSSLGIEHDLKPRHHLPFFNFGNISSNIYTSLVLPIQDYGVAGMLITRLFFSFITVYLTKLIWSKKSQETIIDIVQIIALSMLFFAFFTTAILDKFSGFILNPPSLIKYTVYSFFVIYVFHKVKIKVKI